MRHLFVAAATVLVACSYSPTRATGDSGVDAAIPAGPCEEIRTVCADATTLRACTVIGEDPTNTDCLWGCLAAPDPRCGELVPGANAITPDDVDPAGLETFGDVTLGDGAEIDSAGTVSGGGGNFDYFRRASDTVGVFRFRTLTITGGIVRLVGSRAIVLVANRAITIDGVVTAMGQCGTGDNAQRGGPGGFDGGGDTDGGDIGFGLGGGPGAEAATSGGGGGGHGAIGGLGGNPVAVITGGLATGEPEIPTLVGGSGGGAGGGNSGYGRGGGGGGAVQLVSNTIIMFGDNGGINAGGCGGDSDSGGGPDGGGGGGAGGTLLLEAPTVAGTGKLAVNGGAGGSGGNGTSGTGQAGQLSRQPALPEATGGTDGVGGVGGAGASFVGGLAPNAADEAGGGGGAVGRIRFHTRTGSVAMTGEMSPALTDSSSTCTAAPAPVQ